MNTVITALLVAFFGSVIISALSNIFITEKTLPQVGLCLLFSLLIATAFAGSSLTFWLIFLVPLWGAALVLSLIILIATFGNILVVQPLSRRGFLGRYRKWLNELEGDEYFEAAIHLLDGEKIDEIAHMSADKEHFRQQIIEEADVIGGKDHEN